MAVQKIITLPNPILRQKSKPVQKIDKRVHQIIQNLHETLSGEQNPKGVGLAAPQIGNLVRICLVYSKPSHKILTLINPEITWQSKRISRGVVGSKNPYEGCLSVPGIWGIVERHKQIKVRYLTPNSQTVIRKFSGLTGVVAQHEIDHLNGILFIDRILKQHGKLYKIEKVKEGKEVFTEVELT